MCNSVPTYQHTAPRRSPPAPQEPADAHNPERSQMNVRKIAALGGLVATAAIGTSIALASSANAATPTAGPGNGITSNTLTGNKSGAQTYQDPVFGLVKVNETQHPQFDTVSAKFVGTQTAASLGMYPGYSSTVGWNSDFGSHSGQTGTLTYTINADGTGYTGQATYNS